MATTRKANSKGLVPGRDDDFGGYIAKRLEAEERQIRGGAKTVKKTGTPKKKK